MEDNLFEVPDRISAKLREIAGEKNWSYEELLSMISVWLWTTDNADALILTLEDYDAKD